MRRIRSMLVPVRGQIRKRSERAPLPEMGAWLPWIRPHESEIVRFRDRIATRLRMQAGLETFETQFIADGHTGDEWKELLAQREREVKHFHEIGLRPVFIEGPLPIADRGLTTLQSDVDSLSRTESASRPGPRTSEPRPRFLERLFRLRSSLEARHSLRDDPARSRPLARGECPAREVLESAPLKQALLRLLAARLLEAIRWSKRS